VAVVASRVNPVDWLGLRWRPGPPLLLGVMVGVAGVLATVVTGMFAYGLELAGVQEWLLQRLGHRDPSEAMQDVVKAFDEVEDPTVLAMLCVTAVVVAPVTEEVIFRGYLYPVAKRFAGRGCAVLFSAGFFAMIHLNVMALLPLVFLATILVLAYEFSGSIWVPIGIHMVFNGITVFFQLAAKFEWIQMPQG
jgi:membrane protease YdiL (CAAX protease family)